jgi:cystathionine beta-lyase
VIAHTAALRDGGPWLDALLAGLDSNRRLLGSLLAQHLPEVGYRPPQATYLAWLDCRALKLGAAGLDATGQPDEGRGLVTLSTGPAAAFLEQARVAVSAGSAFGTGGDGHVRLNFATSAAILTEAVDRMGAVRSSRQ